MIDWMILVDFAIGVAGVMLTSLGLILSIACRPMERWTRVYFIANFTVLFVYTFAVSVDYFAMIYNHGFLVKPMIFAESLASSLLMPMLTVYMLRLCREAWSKSPLFIATVALWVVYFALLVYTQFTTAIYSVGPDGFYRRGPLYPLLLVPPVAIMLLNIIGLCRRWGRLTGRQRNALLIYMAAPLAAMVLQMFFYGLLLVAFGTIAGALAMFVFILTEQMDMAVIHTRQSAEKDFGMKVLQMRPHFIYNAMTSIYYLVDSDPDLAKEAIRDFSKYLHQNFNAVVKTEQVPFEEELAHTQAYLAVEQARFGDQLEVTYDTPHTVFRLPPLTLEPIVENAVKHGMDPNRDPLRVLIRTRALDGGSEITVENNGADFNPMESDGDGIGLNSVRDRLARMCGGELRITPKEGGGAIATLWIPDRPH